MNHYIVHLKLQHTVNQLYFNKKILSLPSYNLIVKCLFLLISLGSFLFPHLSVDILLFVHICKLCRLTWGAMLSVLLKFLQVILIWNKDTAVFLPSNGGNDYACASLPCLLQSNNMSCSSLSVYKKLFPLLGLHNILLCRCTLVI